MSVAKQEPEQLFESLCQAGMVHLGIVTDRNELSFHEFLEIPLHRRVMHLLQSEVTFFLDGEQVPTTEALQCIQTGQK